MRSWVPASRPYPECRRAAAPSRAAAESLVQQMKDDADGSVAVTAERATGKVRLRPGGLNGDLMPGVQATR